MYTDEVAKIALALPEVNERESHGAPCFFLRDKKPVCYFHPDGSHGSGRVSIWCPAESGANDDMVASDPERFFRPSPSASGVFRDWLGVFLDAPDGDPVDWDEVAAIIRAGYRKVAPKKLSAKLDG